MNAWTRRGLLFDGSAIAIIVVSNAALAQRTAAPTVSPQNASPPAEVILWRTALATHLGRFKRYPAAVRSPENKAPRQSLSPSTATVA
jgi:hypothetical protein